VFEITTTVAHAQKIKIVPIILAGFFQSLTITCRGACIACSVLQNGQLGRHLM
jgi:hypothetical protein